MSRRRPPARGATPTAEQLAGYAALYGERMPTNWRARLPSPSVYYARELADLAPPSITGWARATCPFHNDRNQSLLVQVTGDRGSWRCDGACGGGDLVGFHQRRTGLPFKAAVRDLVRRPA